MRADDDSCPLRLRQVILAFRDDDDSDPLATYISDANPILPGCGEKSAIPSGFQSHTVNRALGRRQLPSASYGQTSELL